MDLLSGQILVYIEGEQEEIHLARAGIWPPLNFQLGSRLEERHDSKVLPLNCPDEDSEVEHHIVVLSGHCQQKFQQRHSGINRQEFKFQHRSW